MRKGNERLIHELEALGYLRTMHIKEAFRTVPRNAFVPETLSFDAFRNTPLILPDGGILSQPMIFSFMLEQAHLQQGNKILFFDDGSGWEGNMIASIVSFAPEHGFVNCLVFAIESNPKLIKTARNHSESFGFLEKGILRFLPEDAAVLQYAPFDKIISIRKFREGIPNRWREALAIGGRIVVPVGENIVVSEKKSTDVFDEKKFFGFHFPE